MEHRETEHMMQAKQAKRAATPAMDVGGPQSEEEIDMQVRKL